MPSRSLILLSSLVVAASLLPEADRLPALPSGYAWAEAVRPLPEALSEVHADGRYRIVIQRQTGRDPLGRFVRVAEKLEPTERRVLARGGIGFIMAEPWSLDSGRPVSGPRWWWSEREKGALTVAFAATGRAVEHYLQQARSIRDRSYDIEGVELVYFALASGEIGAEVVVEQMLRWSYMCSALCGQGFTLERTVVFDGEGEIVSVDGDQFPSLWVS